MLKCQILSIPEFICQVCLMVIYCGLDVVAVLTTGYVESQSLSTKCRLQTADRVRNAD